MFIFAADLAQFRRDAPESQARAEALIGMAQEQGFSYWAAQGAIVRGWTLSEQGNDGEGILQMCQGLDALRATGAALGLRDKTPAATGKIKNILE